MITHFVFCLCLFVSFTGYSLLDPVSTPKGVDFCVHDRFYSRLKGSRAPSSGRFFIRATLRRSERYLQMYLRVSNRVVRFIIMLKLSIQKLKSIHLKI